MKPSTLMNRAAAAAAIALTTVSACFAAQLVSRGILGNSGEAGPGLVRVGPGAPAAGIGVVYDRFGTLWSRGAGQTLNRYSLDGRVLAAYPLPPGSSGWNGNDLITEVGDLLVLKLGTSVVTLPVTAAAGSTPRDLGVKADRISFGSCHGQITAAYQKQLFTIDTATGKLGAPIALSGDPYWVEMGADGAMYAVVDWQVHRYIAGVEDTAGWPKPSPGERPELIGDYWFGQSWAGTIRRFDSSLQASPGVVLGGASGSFIGHLDQDTDVINGRGLSRIRPGLMAECGMDPFITLLSWQPDALQFEPVRRIGSIPECRGLGLDRDGNVWWHAGGWRWDDSCDTPIRYGVNLPDWPGISQAAMIDGRRMVAIGRLWGHNSFYHGRIDQEVSADIPDNTVAIPADARGAVVVRTPKGLRLILAGAKGDAMWYAIDDNGRYQNVTGTLTLTFTQTPVELTSLALGADGTLLAAVDGTVVVMKQTGDNWTEQRRWSSWSNGSDSFGRWIAISSDAGRLWVSDRTRDRVLVFEPSATSPAAQFGATDHGGPAIDTLDSPEALQANGNRAVVFDSKNERLVKLEYLPGP